MSFVLQSRLSSWVYRKYILDLYFASWWNEHPLQYKNNNVLFVFAHFLLCIYADHRQVLEKLPIFNRVIIMEAPRCSHIPFMNYVYNCNQMNAMKDLIQNIPGKNINNETCRKYILVTDIKDKKSLDV